MPQGHASNGVGGACVEVADLETSVGVGDSKAPEAGHLTFSHDGQASLTLHGPGAGWTFQVTVG
ncbi:DUF397 domain-containing protein [Actinomadura sp. 7K507]|nr:DUF397 domain-containing protein [Actinomadura sp. 7K507]TDC73700.1 DUF397 domain-containing protein [Actinomadura sp. 7K507]